MRKESNGTFFVRSSCIHQMDRLRADHSWRTLSADKHLLSDQVTDIDSADGFKAIESFAIIRNDHETDFIHMRVEHDARARFFRRAPDLVASTLPNASTLTSSA